MHRGSLTDQTDNARKRRGEVEANLDFILLAALLYMLYLRFLVRRRAIALSEKVDLLLAEQSIPSINFYRSPRTQKFSGTAKLLESIRARLDRLAESLSAGDQE